MLLLLGSAVAVAAVKQTSVSVDPFSALKVSGSFSVSLVRGTDYRVLLSVEEGFMDYVVCGVSAGELTVDLDERFVPAEVKRQFRGKGTPDPVFSAIIYVPEGVKSVALTGKAVLRDTEDVFDNTGVEFSLVDNAAIRQLDLTSQSIIISLQNKSTADIKAICKQLDASTANSSSLSMDETSESASYSLQGSSKIIAKSRGSQVSVKTKANSTMTLVGSGESISYDLSGTSEVNAVDYEVPDARIVMTSVCMLSQAAYKSLTLNLNGGSTLLFAGDPVMKVENIKSSTVSRINGGKTGSRL